MGFESSALPNMDINQYIRLYGWEPDDLTPDEIRQVKEELKAIENGIVILDGVLFWKENTLVY